MSVAVKLFVGLHGSHWLRAMTIENSLMSRCSLSQICRGWLKVASFPGSPTHEQKLKAGRWTGNEARLKSSWVKF